jgi:thiol-disulfide isomerase/thioredoxin
MNAVTRRLLASTLVALAGLASPALAQDKAPAAPAQAEPNKEEPKKEEKILKVGDEAPKLQIEKFLKGDEIKEFKKGHVYVVEFWATWCGPCIKAFPHLSELQAKHKGKLTVVGVNIWERYSSDTLDKVTKFVEGQGDKMAYTVAFDGPGKATDKAYMGASKQNGIPCAFIVDGEGKIAYIGHPMGMDKTLEDVLAGKFDMKKASEQAEKKAASAAKAAEIEKRIQEAMTAGKMDEAMKAIDEFVALGTDEAPMAASFKFNHMLENGKADEAYAYAEGLATGLLKDDAMGLNSLAWGIVDPERGLEKPNYKVALKIAERASELTKHNDAMIIDTVARCHFGLGDKAKAIELQTKAVELSKGEMKDQMQKTLDEYKAAK